MRPHDRGFRATHRDATAICAIHDASYRICLELKGSISDIKLIFLQITDPSLSTVANQLYEKNAEF